jgi:hypothetical protein
MATQGIVSVIDKTGKTKIKIIAGCDGYNAKKLADHIKKEQLLDLQSIYDAALALDFGSKSSLVVINKDGFIYEEDDELPERYFQTFDDPKFNPRWELGTAAYTEIIYF